MRHRTIGAGWALGLVLAWAAGAAWAQVAQSDPRLDTAIEQLRDKLLESLEGSWASTDISKSSRVGIGAGGETTGAVGLVVTAALEAGARPQDERIQAAMKWLTQQKETQTYSLGCRMMAYAAMEKSMPGQYRSFLAKDTKQMFDSVKGGRIGYTALGASTQEPYWDNSNTQFAVLGLWMASEANVEIPAVCWRRAMEHWTKAQNADGGWDYRGEGKGATYAAAGGSYGSMTAAGVASLFVCLDKLSGGDYAACTGKGLPRPLAAGLGWLDRNYALGGHRGQCTEGYYLYALERVGLAGGHRYFGEHDWFKEGSDALLARQEGPAGRRSAGDPRTASEPAFVTLFLCRGRYPVAFNKLQYNGDWNNRPRAAAYLTSWASRMMERPMAWQIVNVERPAEQWHDAPILLITGSRAPKFTDADLERLRTYVQQGGTILSVTECSGKEFDAGIRGAYRQILPAYEMKTCGPDHPLYSKKVYFDIPRTIPISVISNGVRPLVIHVNADLPIRWQNLQFKTSKEHFEVMLNVLRYVADGPHVMRHRGVSHWPAPQAPSTPTRSAILIRLRHSGNYDPEPLAWQRMKLLLRRLVRLDLTVTDPIAIEQLPAQPGKLACLTGTGKLNLTRAESAALAQFLRQGGTLLVDAAGGDHAFASSARTALADLLGGAKPVPLKEGDPLFRLPGFPIEKLIHRRTAAAAARGTEPELSAFLLDRRRAVYFSEGDITVGLLGIHVHGIQGFAPETAWEVARNMVLSTLPEFRPAAK